MVGIRKRLLARSATFLFVFVAFVAMARAAEAGSMTIAWDASGGGAVGYYVYWGTQTGVYTASLNVGNTTTA
jgi:hypothetical protein